MDGQPAAHAPATSGDLEFTKPAASARPHLGHCAYRTRQEATPIAKTPAQTHLCAAPAPETRGERGCLRGEALGDRSGAAAVYISPVRCGRVPARSWPAGAYPAATRSGVTRFSLVLEDPFAATRRHSIATSHSIARALRAQLPQHTRQRLRINDFFGSRASRQRALAQPRQKRLGLAARWLPGYGRRHWCARHALALVAQGRQVEPGSG